jgi:hypothetical protein
VLACVRLYAVENDTNKDIKQLERDVNSALSDELGEAETLSGSELQQWVKNGSKIVVGETMYKDNSDAVLISICSKDW